MRRRVSRGESGFLISTLDLKSTFDMPSPGDPLAFLLSREGRPASAAKKVAGYPGSGEAKSLRHPVAGEVAGDEAQGVGKRPRVLRRRLPLLVQALA